MPKKDTKPTQQKKVNSIQKKVTPKKQPVQHKTQTYNSQNDKPEEVAIKLEDYCPMETRCFACKEIKPWKYSFLSERFCTKKCVKVMRQEEFDSLNKDIKEINNVLEYKLNRIWELRTSDIEKIEEDI
jgi:hypothetical protein